MMMMINHNMRYNKDVDLIKAHTKYLFSTKIKIPISTKVTNRVGLKTTTFRSVDDCPPDWNTCPILFIQMLDEEGYKLNLLKLS